MITVQWLRPTRALHKHSFPSRCQQIWTCNGNGCHWGCMYVVWQSPGPCTFCSSPLQCHVLQAQEPGNYPLLFWVNIYDILYHMCLLIHAHCTLYKVLSLCMSQITSLVNVRDINLGTTCVYVTFVSLALAGFLPGLGEVRVPVVSGIW